MGNTVTTTDDLLSFEYLAKRIIDIQDLLLSRAAHAVNLSLTARNWIVGYYIVEYEQKGSDRAQYGEALLKRLASRINKRGLGERRLYEFRQMYLVYPYLGTEIIPYILKDNDQILRLPTAKSEQSFLKEEILRLPTAISPSLELEKWQTPPQRLFNNLSATHLIYLSNIKEPLKRTFYEQEVIHGCWTIKELDRQVSSLYYERMGLSKSKKTLQEYTNVGRTQIQASDIIHNPMAMEFLNLPEDKLVTESKLETAILNHLQQFLLELGNGFCFESRQKRLLIDQDYFKADLVFYHRILKCHFIVELKIDRFRHEYASQLNMYLNYFRHEIMQPDDNPPIGLLLCTDYGETTVRYATEGLSQNLFVSKYRLQLPSEEDIKSYLLQYISEKDFINDKEK
jgi:predicted nuclease of restriction endonuclease-like (RecB) superfamily